MSAQQPNSEPIDPFEEAGKSSMASPNAKMRLRHLKRQEQKSQDASVNDQIEDQNQQKIKQVVNGLNMLQIYVS